jgi:hypothetical protein
VAGSTLFPNLASHGTRHRHIGIAIVNARL